MARRRKPAPPARRRRGQGSVTLRQDGRYGARTPRDRDGRRQHSYHYTREDAERWLADRLNPVTMAGLGTPDTTLGNYLARWYTMHEAGLAEQTKTLYLQAIRSAEPLAATPIRDLRPDHFAALWAEMGRTGKTIRLKGGKTKQAPLAHTTISARRTVLLAALERAVPRLISENPIRLAKLRKQQAPEPEVWPRESIAAFLHTAQERASPFLLVYRLALALGPRVGELRALQWQDVDWERGELAIRRSLETTGAEKGTKTNQARRVPLPAALLAELKAERDRHAGPRKWLLTYRHDRPFGLATLYKDYRAIQQAAHLPCLTIHDLRHCAITMMLSDGVPVVEVAAIVGHANPAITLRVYAHWIASDHRRSTASMLRTLYGEGKIENGSQIGSQASAERDGNGGIVK